MVTWARIPDTMQLSCKSFTVASSLGSSDRIASASATIRTGLDLDVTRAGGEIGNLAEGIELGNLSLRIGDLVCLSSTGNGNIPACANFPAALDNYCENTYYPGLGFVGYVTDISLRAGADASDIEIALGDEAWMWNRFPMLPLRFNFNDATRMVMKIAEVASAGYTTKEIIAFMQRLMNHYGHVNFDLNYGLMPDRVADPAVTNFGGGTVWQAFQALIGATYGSAYRIYSGGAGHIEIRRVETNLNALRAIRIDKTNLVDNAVEIREQDSANQRVDVVVGFGDAVKYYVGDAAIDNELVPAWDWWMDGYFLVIDNATGQPAMYDGENGVKIPVNPFNICAVVDGGVVRYVAPGTGGNVEPFVYGLGTVLDEDYPHYQTFLKIFNSHPMSRYCHVTSYAMDAYLQVGRSRPMHEGRFKRWRLKDNIPHVATVQLHSGSPRQEVFYDIQFFPRRVGAGGVKALSGDPVSLNLTGSAKRMVNTGGQLANTAYVCHIAPDFMNSATHRISRQRLKPGNYTDGSGALDDSRYESIEDPSRPGEQIEDTISTRPIFVKYDLVTNILSPEQLARMAQEGETPYTAERVEADLMVSNYFVQSSQPLVALTSTLDKSTFRRENPTKNYQRTTSNGKDRGDEKFDINRIFSPLLRGAEGPIVGEGSQPLRWYYPLRHGFAPVESFIPFQDEHPIHRGTDNVVGWAKSGVPFGIPRVEFFGFVYYEDKPELEPPTVLADLDSYYWKNIRCCLKYPEGTPVANRNVMVMQTSNQVMERQLGGSYDYDKMNNDFLVSDAVPGERIAYYRSRELGTAISENIQNQSQEMLGSHVTVLKFPLYNAQYRFNERAEDFICGRIPAAQTTYYERADIKPERGGANIGVFAVEHMLDNGWLVRVTHGGGVPRLKDLYEDQKRVQGNVRDLIQARSKNSLVTLTGVEAYSRFK